MSRLKTCLLCSIVSKEPAPQTESLDAHARQWFSDGYRTSVPGTNLCRQDSDCDPGEICQAGYCAGLHRYYDTYGVFRGNEYSTMIQEPSYHTHPHVYGYLQMYRPVADIGTLGTVLTGPYSQEPPKVRKYHSDYGYSNAYDYS